MPAAQHIEAPSTVPGNDTDSTTLYDSTAGVKFRDYATYLLTLRNSHEGELRGYYSEDNGQTWRQFFGRFVAPAGAGQAHKIPVRIDGYKAVKFDWVNGGVEQETWEVSQALTHALVGDLEPLTTAARVRAPEASTSNFAKEVGATHAVYEVHDDWKGRCVDVVVHGAADGKEASVWILFGTEDDIEVDDEAEVTGSAPAWVGDVKIGRPIPAGSSRDYYIRPGLTHFAVVSDDDTHKPVVSIFLSDQSPTEA